MELEMSSAKNSTERLIKKYPNRRLYDTQTSSYITLTDVKQLVLDADEFTVVDAKTSEDLTRSILLQIILEEEANGAPMFSSAVLAQIIRYYGHAMQGMMGSYLEKNVQAFTDIQNKFTANAAWTVLWALAHNLTRAAGALASGFHARATTATIRAHLINVPARIARRAGPRLTS